MQALHRWIGCPLDRCAARFACARNGGRDPEALASERIGGKRNAMAPLPAVYPPPCDTSAIKPQLGNRLQERRKAFTGGFAEGGERAGQISIARRPHALRASR